MKQIDVLTGLWKRKPFKPFGVAMKDGSKIQVDHPEYLIVREGSAFFVDREGHFTIFDGHQGKTVLAVGHSIFNRTCKVNIGQLLHGYGGGGHKGAGTCQLEKENAERQTAEIIAKLKA